MKHKIRLVKAKINNIKNVGEGIIEVEKLNDSIEGAFGNVIGIYGQNGSGKTTFVDACEILKELMSGNKLKVRDKNNELINEKFEKYIMIEKKSMILDYEFYVSLDTDYYVTYKIEIGRYKESFTILNEIVKYKPLDIEGTKLNSILEVELIGDEYKAAPLARINTLRKYDKNAQVDIGVAYELANENAQSIIFSEKVIKLFSNIPENENPLPYSKILNELKKYATWELLIVDKHDIGLINMDVALPLNIRYFNEKTTRAIGKVGLRLSGNSQIPESVFDIVTKVFTQINIILNEIVPGLSIRLDKVGVIINDDEETLNKVQLLSVRNGKEIDFQYESEGIKKIVSILNYMTAMFNSDSVCLIVDEFDSGIHEYLIGEILSVLKDRCEGQFIFTSHNLRPLEKLNKNHILFTTTNENRKYIKFKDIKPVQNLRDCYYRAIQLGGQDEELYEETKSYNIKRAFRKSGMEVIDE